MSLVIKVLIWIAYALSLYFSIFFFLVFIEKQHKMNKERSKTALTRYPLVTILIPAFNEEATIVETLRSVNNIDYPKEKIQAIVIDDGSKDTTLEKITQFIKDKKQFEVISHTNRGKAASLNVALKQTRGEFFACLDADSFVDPLTLKKMLAIYEQDEQKDTAIVTPAMKVHKPKTILQKIQWLEYLVIIFIARLSSHLDSLYVAPGPFSLYRTKVINELGGFDEKNITEDQEIAYRVQKHQYRIKQAFDGYVHTVAPNKIKPFFKQRKRWYLGGMICLHKYKSMIANRKYGDFGIMQLMKNVVGYSLAIIGIILAGYIIGRPLLNFLEKIISINYQLFSYVSTIDINVNPFTFLLLDIKLIVIVTALFIIGGYFFYLAHRNAKEKVNSVGWIPIIPYFLFYYLLKGIILLVCVVEFGRGKKQKW